MMSKSFLILLAIVASVSAQSFQYSALLDADGDYYIRWNVSEATNSLTMRIEAFGKGWLSLLLPSSDGSYGDLWFGGYDDTTNQGYLQDYRVNLTSTGHTAPELDRSQDLTLVSASYDAVTAFTFVTLTRPLNTGDARDDVAIERGVELSLGWSFHDTSDSAADAHTDAGFTSITLVPAKSARSYRYVK